MKPSYIIDLHPADLVGAKVMKLPNDEGELRECIVIPTEENGIYLNRKGFWRWRFAAWRNNRAVKPYYLTAVLSAASLNYMEQKGLLTGKKHVTPIVGGIWLPKKDLVN